MPRHVNNQHKADLDKFTICRHVASWTCQWIAKYTGEGVGDGGGLKGDVAEGSHWSHNTAQQPFMYNLRTTLGMDGVNTESPFPYPIITFSIFLFHHMSTLIPSLHGNRVVAITG